jgi:hypothetical protein
MTRRDRATLVGRDRFSIAIDLDAARAEGKIDGPVTTYCLYAPLAFGLAELVPDGLRAPPDVARAERRHAGGLPEEFHAVEAPHARARRLAGPDV